MSIIIFLLKMYGDRIAEEASYGIVENLSIVLPYKVNQGLFN